MLPLFVIDRQVTHDKYEDLYKNKHVNTELLRHKAMERNKKRLKQCHRLLALGATYNLMSPISHLPSPISHLPEREREREREKERERERERERVCVCVCV